MLYGSAFAQVRGNIANDGQNHVGQVVVVTDPTPTVVIRCGDTLHEYNSVMTDPGGGAAIITEISIDPAVVVEPGNRFEITAQTPCDGRLDLTLEPITPGP